MLIKLGGVYRDQRTRKLASVRYITANLVQIEFLSNKYRDWYTFVDFKNYFKAVQIKK